MTGGASNLQGTATTRLRLAARQTSVAVSQQPLLAISDGHLRRQKVMAIRGGPTIITVRLHFCLTPCRDADRRAALLRSKRRVQAATAGAIITPCGTIAR